MRRGQPQIEYPGQPRPRPTVKQLDVTDVGEALLRSTTVEEQRAALGLGTAAEEDIDSGALVAGDVLYWDGAAWQPVPGTKTDGNVIKLVSGVPTWSTP